MWANQPYAGPIGDALASMPSALDMAGMVAVTTGAGGSAATIGRIIAGAAVPLPCVPTAFAAKPPPLPCVLPLPAWLRHCLYPRLPGPSPAGTLNALHSNLAALQPLVDCVSRNRPRAVPPTVL